MSVGGGESNECKLSTGLISVRLRFGGDLEKVEESGLGVELEFSCVS
jgi:hypothetical protein